MYTTTTESPSTRGVRTIAKHLLTWRRVAFWSGIVTLPTAVAVLESRRSKLAGGVAGGLTALALAGLRWQFQRWFTEEPAYEIEKQLGGGLELRHYQPHVEARTRVLTDDHDLALEHGFERLAAYIFGGNQRGEKLDMSTLVTTTDGEKLEMTAPVINQRSGHSHVMAFVMPEGRDLASLPKPHDDRVELDEVPARRVAVLGYRGRYTAEAVKRHQDELMHKVRDAGLKVIGAPMFAGFDPPNTFPWLRRNEVWVEVA